MDGSIWDSIVLRLVAVVLLVAANAFFVAAEFALVAARRTRIDAMVRRGDRRAKVVKKAIQSLDKYISGTQLGITLASLGLGWIGEPALARTIEGAFTWLPEAWQGIATHGVAASVAFAIITFLHIVFGELAPKALALLHPEDTSLWVAPPLIVFTTATNPFIWLLNGTANGLLRLFGATARTERERVHSPEEIRMLVEQGRQVGAVTPEDARLIEGVFEFSEKSAHDVMTPRTDMVALKVDFTLDQAADVIAKAGRSRYPVFRESLDDVVGVVHAKDVLKGLRSGGPTARVDQLMRPPIFVPGTREVEDVLADMKRQKAHLAIVLDEFGGTAGLVTMEDLLEEIVGPIFDEYDRPVAAPAPEAAAGDGAVFPGSKPVSEVNQAFGLQLDDAEYATIGGFVFGRLGRLPKVGDKVGVTGGQLEVLTMDRRRVGAVRLTLRPKDAAAPAEPPAPKRPS